MSWKFMWRQGESSSLAPSNQEQQVGLRTCTQAFRLMASSSCNLLLTQVCKGSPVQVCIHHVQNPYPSPDGQGGGRVKGSLLEGPPPAGGIRAFLTRGGGISGNRTLPVGGLQFSSSADDYLTFLSLLPPQQTHQRHMVCQAEQFNLLETQEHKRPLIPPGF